MKRTLGLFAVALFSLPFLFSFADESKASHCSLDEYTHNGSVMEVIACDEGVTISYIKPRRGLSRLGIHDGTLLFRGLVSDNGRISGQARVFKRGCGEMTYPVSGRFDQDNRLVLNGQAPVRGGDCVIKRFRQDNLVFDPVAL